MPLDFVNHHFQHLGSSSVIQRSFIDMPVVPGKICLVKIAHVELVQRERVRTAYDVSWAISVDPDHVLDSMVLLDSTIFCHGDYQMLRTTAAGENHVTNPEVFHYPDGIRCPYARLPFFFQATNTNSATADLNVRLFFTLEKRTAQELAVAVLRRGRGETRRVL